MCSRKSAPRRGTDTGANWNVQVYTIESLPQENQGEMILVPLQTIGDPSAVRRRTPLEESDLEPGNMEMEAPESNNNRNWLRNRL